MITDSAPCEFLAMTACVPLPCRARVSFIFLILAVCLRVLSCALTTPFPPDEAKTHLDNVSFLRVPRGGVCTFNSLSFCFLLFVDCRCDLSQGNLYCFCSVLPGRDPPGRVPCLPSLDSVNGVEFGSSGDLPYSWSELLKKTQKQDEKKTRAM